MSLIINLLNKTITLFIGLDPTFLYLIYQLVSGFYVCSIRFYIMPRIYKKKVNSRYASFSVESMNSAIADVQANIMSVKKAAFNYGLNRSTLIYRLKNAHTGSVGKPSILTRDEESVIVHAIQKLGDWGFGIDRNVVADIVQDLIKSDNRASPFTNGKPGRDWMYGFERRWKNELARRIAQPLPANRAYACNEHVINDFFQKLELSIDRLKLRQKPQNIFNVDETGFQTDIGQQKILCRRGFRNPHKTVATSTKTMYTVQVCCSAVGTFLSPYVVYKGSHLYSTWIQGGPDNAKYTCSKSGWMESAHFVEWFEKVFLAETAELEGSKLLVFDGHNSHLSKTIVDLAIANNTELLCLPAHTSSVLQPLDVGVFKTVKSKWRTCLKTYYDETRYKNVDKASFPHLLKTLIDSGAFSRANAISAFQTCGIYPLDRSKITSDKLSTAEPLITGVCMSSPRDEATEHAGTPGSNKPSESTRTVTETPVVNGDVVITPRKRIEYALLAHLRHVTPNEPTEKRKRIRRTLAECLTTTEARDRLAEVDREKVGKKTNESKLTANSKSKAEKRKGSSFSKKMTDSSSTLPKRPKAASAMQADSSKNKFNRFELSFSLN